MKRRREGTGILELIKDVQPPGVVRRLLGQKRDLLADGNPHGDTFSSAWGIDTTVAELVRVLFGDSRCCDKGDGEHIGIN